MKRLLKGLSLVLVLVMCLALPAQAEGLLGKCMEAAYQEGRQVEANISAQLGSGLALFMPEDMYGAVQQLLEETRIVTRWAKDEAGEPVIGLELSIRDVQLLTGEARLAEGGLAVTTSILPGKTLILPIESVGAMAQQLPVELDDQTAAMMAEAGERYLGIFAIWAQEMEGVYTESDQEIDATDTRGGSVRADHLVVTAEQLQELLVRLADEFASDEALQTVLGQYLQASGQEIDMAELSTALSEGTRNMVPLADGAVRMDFYQDADAEMVGLDFAMDPLFEDAPQTAFAQYDRLIEDGLDSYTFQGKLGLGEEGGMAATKISYRTMESHTEPTIDTELLLLGMVQEAGADPISQITLTDERHFEEGDGQERMVDTLTLTMEQLAPDGSAAEDAMPMTCAVDTQSVTSAGAGEDFESDSTATLTFMGMEMGAISLKLASGEYIPQDISGNAVIDLSQATAEDQQALMEELQTGLMQAVVSAVAVLPPELLQMMQG